MPTFGPLTILYEGIFLIFLSLGNFTCIQCDFASLFAQSTLRYDSFCCFLVNNDHQVEFSLFPNLSLHAVLSSSLEGNVHRTVPSCRFFHTDRVIALPILGLLLKQYVS